MRVHRLHQLAIKTVPMFPPEMQEAQDKADRLQLGLPGAAERSAKGQTSNDLSHL